MLWFTSDLHFGHANIIDYCNRPFRSVDAMNWWLINSWNANVADGDDVWVLGDVCMGDITKTLRLIEKLNGTKHLLVGNHDRPFRKKPTSVPKEEKERLYLDSGFTSLHHGSTAIDVAGLPALLCHFPYSADPRGVDRFPHHRPVDNGLPLLHGHVHGRWRRNGNQVDVGVDAWGGKPVSEVQIKALLEEEASFVPPLSW